jgi:uncharacterized protein
LKDIIIQIADELKIKENQAASAIALIEKGNTLPFIARYRKEATGGLSDEILRQLEERLDCLKNLKSRKEEVIRLIAQQDKMTPSLEKKINSAYSVTEVDDLYRPYRPKRQTKATVAKDKGLEPLAWLIWRQQTSDKDLARISRDYINREKGIDSLEAAIEGAKDIVAEMISDNAELRKKIRGLARRTSLIVSKTAGEQNTVYEMYNDFSEPVCRLVPHRILALNRGEKEKALSVKLDINGEAAFQAVIKHVMRPGWKSRYLEDAAKASCKRLIFPSIEREIRKELTEMAEEQAIKVFGENLKNLLLQPPVKGKTVLALDPGYRTGNKAAVIDPTGKVLDTDIVYMTLDYHNIPEAEKKLKQLIEKHDVDIIAIGNGTASKETEAVVAALIKKISRTVYYVMVNEAGASVYSASKLAAEELPKLDVAQRSAVSIARRLQDPLAELVKIDPKAIGVGQYQHDVNQKRLSEMLCGIVECCVNQVGVDLNTASPSLLQYVSGITAATAKNIVKMRERLGRFISREQLKKVPMLGEKAFEQCAGFLRIPDADNLLDNTAIHPESYHAVYQLMHIKGYETIAKGLDQIRKEIDHLDISTLTRQIGIGEITLKDILQELKKPGRDPRDKFEQPVFRSDVMHLEDIKTGMVLTGTVRNVTDFGAFVDIGVHQDGLVHISEISDTFVRHPLDILKPGNVVKVIVISVDPDKKRISLSMRNID